MAIRFTFLDRENLMMYPRFWFRAVFSILSGVLNYLYAVDFRMDFLDPAYQSLGLEKLVMFLFAALFCSECIFHVLKTFGSILKKRHEFQGAPWMLAVPSTVLSLIFIFLLVKAFTAFYERPLGFDYSGLLVLNSILLLGICNFVYMFFPLYYFHKYPMELTITHEVGEHSVNLENVAHIFSYSNYFLFTYHSGSRYETHLQEDLEAFYGSLNPNVFFRVDRHAVVNVRACREVRKLKDGSVRITLEPELVLPAHVSAKVDLDAFD